MHTILFDSYRKHQKEIKNNIVKAIFKLPVVAKVLFIGFGICLVYNILAVFFPFFRNNFFVCLLFEIVIGGCLYFYTESFQVKYSDLRLSLYQKYCEDMTVWLEQIGFIVTKENITEIVLRLEKEIDKEEEQRLSRRDRIEKWIQILIIPILLAVFSAVIKEQTNLTMLLTYAITLLIAFASIILAFLNCYNIIDFLKKRKLEQMKSFASDLQGVLDCQFDDKLFLYVNDASESENIMK